MWRGQAKKEREKVGYSALEGRYPQEEPPHNPMLNKADGSRYLEFKGPDNEEPEPQFDNIVAANLKIKQKMQFIDEFSARNGPVIYEKSEHWPI